MFTEEMRSLIGYAILCAAAFAAVTAILRKNWPRIREVFTDENGKWDFSGGFARALSKYSAPEEAEPAEDTSPDEAFMALILQQKGARMADFDPETGWVREHIIFHGRVQGVGFRYQAMFAARELGLTGWVENLPDGTVEMEAQGAPAAIGRMMKHLRSGHWIRIDDMEMEERPVIQGERGFDVRGY